MHHAEILIGHYREMVGIGQWQQIFSTLSRATLISVYISNVTACTCHQCVPHHHASLHVGVCINCKYISCQRCLLLYIFFH